MVFICQDSNIWSFSRCSLSILACHSISQYQSADAYQAIRRYIANTYRAKAAIGEKSTLHLQRLADDKIDSAIIMMSVWKLVAGMSAKSIRRVGPMNGCDGRDTY